MVRDRGGSHVKKWAIQGRLASLHFMEVEERSNSMPCGLWKGGTTALKAVNEAVFTYKSTPDAPTLWFLIANAREAQQHLVEVLRVLPFALPCLREVRKGQAEWPVSRLDVESNYIRLYRALSYYEIAPSLVPELLWRPSRDCRESSDCTSGKLCVMYRCVVAEGQCADVEPGTYTQRAKTGIGLPNPHTHTAFVCA
eukprot:4806283-Amphidinium_carterae.3